MEREVRYCTSVDGTHIAYSVEGEGPTLVALPMFVDSFSLDHLHPNRPGFYQALGKSRSLVRYDIRGTGLSQRSVSDFSLSAMTADLAAVIGSLAVPVVSILASTTSGPTAIKFAAENPQIVQALVLYGTFARVQDAFSVDLLGGLATMARVNWSLAARTLGDLGAGREEGPDNAAAGGKIFLESADGSMAADYLEQNFELDVRLILPQVQARSLLLYRTGDTVVPLSVGQGLAAAIPGARLLALPGSIHAAYAGDWQRVTRAVREFLDEDPATRAITAHATNAPRDSSFRTILFTDLVGHTEMMSRLGDEVGRSVLREHERITREVLKANSGAEVKTMGDGFMASFGSVTKAVECAIALQRAMDDWNATESAQQAVLRVRVGLNAGEPIEEDGDLFGATVILASRIAAKAEGGEILVADTVRGLCSGKGFLFADRGEFVAKGFEEPVRVFEVSWRT